MRIRIRCPGIFLALDLGSGMEKLGPGINIQDPQYCEQAWIRINSAPHILRTTLLAFFLAYPVTLHTFTLPMQLKLESRSRFEAIMQAG
jgi:hypothetical protein